MPDTDQANPTTEQRTREIVRRLRETGHRVTPQRVAILGAFIGHRGHPSAEDIHQELQEDFPMMALSTVYNTLALLAGMGEAVEVSPATPAARFDPDPGDHCHLTCLNCGRIIDLPMGECAKAAEAAQAAQAHGFRPVRQVHQIFGYCADCKQ